MSKIYNNNWEAYKHMPADTQLHEDRNVWGEHIVRNIDIPIFLP